MKPQIPLNCKLDFSVIQISPLEYLSLNAPNLKAFKGVCKISLIVNAFSFFCQNTLTCTKLAECMV